MPGIPARKRALSRYFGSRSIARDVLTEYERLQPIAAFGEWYLADYRATKKSSTILERKRHATHASVETLFSRPSRWA